MKRTPFTIIVPACNEESVIARTLGCLLEGWSEDARPRVIVSCNGCRDDTADIARGFPQVDVIETTAASKSAAINAGLALVADYPVLVVDADIRIGAGALAAIAEVLRQDGVMAAAPSARLLTERSDAWVRAYYRKWSSLGYLETGVGGSGVYGLSEAGARALGTLPPVIGDDTYVRWFFPLDQQRRLCAGRSEAIIEAPRHLSNLLACEVRWQRGNRQLRRMMAEPADDKAANDGVRVAAGAAPTPVDAIIYYGIKLMGRLRLHMARMTGEASVWGRDLSSREALDSGL